MKSTSHSAEQLSGAGTVSVDLPADVAGMLQAEARRRRKSVVSYVRELIEDQIDGREAARRWKDIESGKTKPVPAAEVYKRLGL